MTMLEFGYNRGVPKGTETAWGCRAIVTQDGVVDVAEDRTSAAGPEADRLLRHLDSLPPHGGWQDRASELLRAGVMDTRLDEEFVLYTDDVVVIKGNTQASGGHLYVCAYLRQTPPGQVAKHSVSHRGCEVFRFLTRGWCITQALELINAYPAAAEFIEAADITGWMATST